MEGGKSVQFLNDVFKSCKNEITVPQMRANVELGPHNDQTQQCTVSYLILCIKAIYQLIINIFMYDD